MEMHTIAILETLHENRVLIRSKNISEWMNGLSDIHLIHASAVPSEEEGGEQQTIFQGPGAGSQIHNTHPVIPSHQVTG